MRDLRVHKRKFRSSKIKLDLANGNKSHHTNHYTRTKLIHAPKAYVKPPVGKGNHKLDMKRKCVKENAMKMTSA